MTHKFKKARDWSVMQIALLYLAQYNNFSALMSGQSAVYISIITGLTKD